MCPSPGRPLFAAAAALLSGAFAPLAATPFFASAADPVDGPGASAAGPPSPAAPGGCTTTAALQKLAPAVHKAVAERENDTQNQDTTAAAMNDIAACLTVRLWAAASCMPASLRPLLMWMCEHSPSTQARFSVCAECWPALG